MTSHEMQARSNSALNAAAGFDNWFGVPVCRMRVEDDHRLATLANFLLEKERLDPKRRNYSNGYSNTGWHSEQWSLGAAPAEMGWVTSYFHDSLRKCLDELFSAELGNRTCLVEHIGVDLVFWSVVNKLGDFNLRHVHTSNARDTWSCVLYVSTPPAGSGGEIRFFNPNLAHRCSIGTTLQKLGGQGMYKKIEPATGDLIFFPGWLEHDVMPVTCDEKRVIVAANFGITRLDVRSPDTSTIRRII